MKRILMMLSAAALLTGCVSARPGGANNGATNPALRNPAAERTLAERLPLVTADTITTQNHQAKINEFVAELNRDAKRLDSARSMASAEK